VSRPSGEINGFLAELSAMTNRRRRNSATRLAAAMQSAMVNPGGWIRRIIFVATAVMSAHPLRRGIYFPSQISKIRLRLQAVGLIHQPKHLSNQSGDPLLED